MEGHLQDLFFPGHMLQRKVSKNPVLEPFNDINYLYVPSTILKSYACISSLLVGKITLLGRHTDRSHFPGDGAEA